MKDSAVIGLILAGGAVAGAYLLSRRQDEGGGARAQGATGGGPTYGGGLPEYGGMGGFVPIDPLTGQPIDPITGLPTTTTSPPPIQPSGPIAIGLSPEAEAALIQQNEDTNRQLIEDTRRTNQAVEDAARQQARDSELSRNVNIAVGAGLLAASYRGLANFGKSLVTSAAGIGRNIPAAARSITTSPAAPIIGGAVQGGLSIAQGVKDLQARNQGQGPYANLNKPAAVTAATANTAAATAVGIGSLGLASFDFNKGVRFLGLPVATPGSRPGKTKLFGRWEI